MASSTSYLKDVVPALTRVLLDISSVKTIWFDISRSRALGCNIWLENMSNLPIKHTRLWKSVRYFTIPFPPMYCKSIGGVWQGEYFALGEAEIGKWTGMSWNSRYIRNTDWWNCSTSWGLNWAKLSSNLNWNFVLFHLRFVALKYLRLY